MQKMDYGNVVTTISQYQIHDYYLHSKISISTESFSLTHRTCTFVEGYLDWHLQIQQAPEPF